MTDDSQQVRPQTRSAAQYDLSKVRTVVRSGYAQSQLRYKSEAHSAAERVGSVGRLVGDKDHQAGNIATIAISGLLLLTAAALGGLIFLASPKNTLVQTVEDINTVVLALIALIGTILGYIFGQQRSR